MGNYEELKAAIRQVITTNGNNEITGAVLQQTLLSIINTVGSNATFAGIATPTTNPGTPEQKVFYLATQPGFYRYFREDARVDPGVVSIITNINGASWVVLPTGTTTGSMGIIRFERETTAYARLLFGFPLLSGSVLINNGETTIIVADDTTLANRQDIGPGAKATLTTDKNYIGTGSAVGLTKFDYLPAPIAKNSEDIAKNSEDIAKNSEDIAKNSEDIFGIYDFCYRSLDKTYVSGVNADESDSTYSGDIGKYKFTCKYNIGNAIISNLYIYYKDGSYKSIPVNLTGNGQYSIIVDAEKEVIRIGYYVNSDAGEDNYIILNLYSNGTIWSKDWFNNKKYNYFSYSKETAAYARLLFGFPLLSGSVLINNGETTIMVADDTTLANRQDIGPGAKATLTTDKNYIGTGSAVGLTKFDYLPAPIAKNSEDIETIKTQINIGSFELSLPNKIYAIVGDTLQLFYRGIIKSVDPYKYNILITCSKGKQFPRYYEYTPTIEDVGETSFTVTIKDDNRNVLAQKSCTLVTKDVGSSPVANINVACFGDSLTAAGIWCAEANRRLTGIGGTPTGKELTNIAFVGSKNNGDTGYFGVGGWTWRNYVTKGSPAYRFQVSNVNSLSVGATYSNNGNTFTIMEINVTEGSGNILCSVPALLPTPTTSGVLTKESGSGDNEINYTSVSEDSQNPLWDYSANKMTFIPYANQYAGGAIDVVYTLLTWNGQTPGREDFTGIIEEIEIFANTLHTEFPNAKLKILGIQIPSIRGGMGANYGATGTSYADGYGMVVTALNLNKAYQDFANREEYVDFVEFVNVSSQFDTEYNMPHIEKEVNTRNSVTEWQDTNGVHPSNDGYLQIGDIVYRNFIANFCQ